MAATYSKLTSAFGSALGANQRIEIMTQDGGHIIQNHTVQVEEKSDHIRIKSPDGSKTIMTLYDDHIVGVKLR
jgi:hypothetical protein